MHVDGYHLVKHNLSDHTHVLTIRNTAKDDLGEYKCKAYNDMGETTGPPIGLKDTPGRPVWEAGEDIDKDTVKFTWKVLSFKEITGIEVSILNS